MPVTELLDDLGDQLRRQPLVEARTGCQSLQASLLDVLSDDRPLVSDARDLIRDIDLASRSQQAPNT